MMLFIAFFLGFLSALLCVLLAAHISGAVQSISQNQEVRQEQLRKKEAPKASVLMVPDKLSSEETPAEYALRVTGR